MINSAHLAKRWRPENPSYFLQGTSVGVRQLWYNCALVITGMAEIYEQEARIGRMDVFEEDKVVGELQNFLQVCKNVHITEGLGVGTPEAELKSHPLNWLTYVAGQILPEVEYFIQHAGLSDFVTEFRDGEQFLLSIPTNQLTDRHMQHMAHKMLLDHVIPSFLGLPEGSVKTREILKKLYDEFETLSLKELLDRS